MILVPARMVDGSHPGADKLSWVLNGRQSNVQLCGPVVHSAGQLINARLDHDEFHAVPNQRGGTCGLVRTCIPSLTIAASPDCWQYCR